MWRSQGWAPYVPVAQRQKQAAKEANRLLKKGAKLSPVKISGKAIVTTFWGKAWCDNLGEYSDYSNRLPRGRTYVRNGSVMDLQIEHGKITALVSGSRLYKIVITIQQLARNPWKALRADCAASVTSLLDLMRGRLSQEVIRRLTDLERGLFPKPKEITFNCSCPDGAWMCKHIAATLYGVGNRLDTSPELFFKLRGVDEAELVSDAMSVQQTDDIMGLSQHSQFANEDLGEMFGIELAPSTPKPLAGKSPTVTRKSKPTPKATSPKKAPSQIAGTAKAIIKKVTAKKTRAKKTPAKKTTVEKSTIKKTTVKKTSVKKTTVKKAAVKKAVVSRGGTESNAKIKKASRKRSGQVIQRKKPPKTSRNLRES
ncbi:MAG: SWIM zinc finger family protein [Planctomycetota bacterium]|nr:SWIM zinc finger family protein [Planctomycetota bacterium]